MKRIFILLMVIFQCFFVTASWSESKLEMGKEAYVWARNGVWLREEPSADAREIEKLFYGTPLKILSDRIGTDESVAIYGNQNSMHKKYSIPGSWRRVKVENAQEDSKEGYLFDGWLLSLPPLKCEIKMETHSKESKQSCENIADWCARNFGLVKKEKVSSDKNECDSCGVTRYIFGKGFVYEEDEPGYGSGEGLIMPGLSLSEGSVAALGLFTWWDGDGEKPRIELSERRVVFYGTYQMLAIELNKKGVRVTDFCRDC